MDNKNNQVDRMNKMRVARIHYQSKHMVMYKVPSESNPGTTHLVEYGPGDKRSCSCIGAEWLEKKGIAHMKLDRHQRMTTIQLAEPPSQGQSLYQQATKIIKTRACDLAAAWGHIRCTQPVHYDEFAIHCEGCPLYPVVCNIHKITYGPRKKKQPLIWKLQKAIYNGRRKESREILNQIRSALKTIEVPNGSEECDQCHTPMVIMHPKNEPDYHFCPTCGETHGRQEEEPL